MSRCINPYEFKVRCEVTLRFLLAHSICRLEWKPLFWKSLSHTHSYSPITVESDFNNPLYEAGVSKRAKVLYVSHVPCDFNITEKSVLCPHLWNILNWFLTNWFLTLTTGYTGVRSIHLKEKMTRWELKSTWRYYSFWRQILW